MLASVMVYVIVKMLSPVMVFFCGRVLISVYGINSCYGVDPGNVIVLLVLYCFPVFCC